jgi:hypothetical protein
LAQSSYDVLTFETPVTFPSDKAYNNTSNVMLSGYEWILPGVYLGSPTSDDYKIDNRSARFRKLNDTTGANGYMEMKENYLFGFEYFGFMAAMYGNDAGGKLTVAYSIDDGVTWIPSDTFTIAPNNTPTKYTIHEHIFMPVRFKITKLDNTDARINVDSVFCIAMQMPPQDLSIARVAPKGRTHPSVNRVAIVFDQHIVAGDSGKITLVNTTTNTVTSYNLSHPDIEIKSWEDSLIINNVQLEPLNRYYVLMDSFFIKSLFFNDYSDGIYDTTESTFYTTLYYLDNVVEPFISTIFCQRRFP